MLPWQPQKLNGLSWKKKQAGKAAVAKLALPIYYYKFMAIYQTLYFVNEIAAAKFNNMSNACLNWASSTVIATRI
mgnify:CR=1 FL=1